LHIEKSRDSAAVEELLLATPNGMNSFCSSSAAGWRSLTNTTSDTRSRFRGQHTHLIAYCGDHGIPEVNSATMLAIIGGFSLIGSAVSGWLCDRFNPRFLLFVPYGSDRNGA
jgi:hypothetical protein